MLDASEVIDACFHLIRGFSAIQKNEGVSIEKQFGLKIGVAVGPVVVCFSEILTPTFGVWGGLSFSFNNNLQLLFFTEVVNHAFRMMQYSESGTIVASGAVVERIDPKVLFTTPPQKQTKIIVIFQKNGNFKDHPFVSQKQVSLEGIGRANIFEIVVEKCLNSNNSLLHNYDSLIEAHFPEPMDTPRLFLQSPEIIPPESIKNRIFQFMDSEEEQSYKFFNFFYYYYYCT